MSAANGTTASPADTPPLENRGPVVLAVSLVMVSLSTVFVVLRCVSRLGMVKRWAWDDTFIIVAWFLAFGFTFSICWGVRSGLGLHETNIPEESQLPLRKSEYAFSVLYNPVLMATKTSILCFYLTLARNLKLFKWATWITMGVVNVAGFALTLLNVFQCQPMWTLFLPTIPSFAVCTDLVIIYLSSSPVNIITDLAILVLPFPVLTNMRLPRKQKIILIITFSFGLFVAIVDVVRIAYLQQAFEVRLKEVGQENAATSKVLQQDDFSWYASLSFLWSAIEVHIGIVCACVPSLKPLAARVMPSMLRDITNPRDNTRPREGSAQRDSQKMGGLDFASSALESPSLRSPVRAHFSTMNGDTASLGASDVEAPRRPSHIESVQSEKSHRNPTSPARGPDEIVDFMEFLTAPDVTSPRPYTDRQSTANTLMTSSTAATDRRRGSVPFFDFYNMERKKPMTRLSNSQSFAPLAAVTILFFLWGFAYGLLDVLNSKFGEVNNISQGQAMGLHAAYFGAYAFGPLTVGQAVLIKLGFRATFITGLAIYAVGTLVIWPSAVLSSYPAFAVCNFIIGFGVSILEVGANPFIALCGPPRYAENRLNISQGVQAIGTIVAPLLATKVLFKSVNDGGALVDVQWAYLGIAFFDILLALIFYYLPLPEGTDEDFERVAEKRESINSATIFGKKIIYVTLAFGIFSQFVYVGAQEAAAEVYQPYSAAVAPSSALDPFSSQTVGHTVFALGRFACAFLSLFMRPRTVLFFIYIGMIISSAISMVATGGTGIAMIAVYTAFQAGAFPLIYAITLRGLGSFTKRGSVLLTMAISGGAVFPVIMGPIQSSRGAPYSMVVVLACSVFGAIFPVYLMFTPKARAQVDPVLGKNGGTRLFPFQIHGSRERLRQKWVRNWHRPSPKPTAPGAEDEVDHDDEKHKSVSA